VNNSLLSTLQREFLKRFFATAIGPHFYLTGGTVLAAFHLRHRLSVDLDLFTLDDLALREANALVPRLAQELGCHIGQSRRTENFIQFLLEPQTGEPLQVDLVRDFGPQYGERIEIDGVIVDSIENIGANKLTAILGRVEPKDFVDLYFILQAGYDFNDLLAKAQAKDLGMQPFFMAGALLQVRKLHHLPATTPSLTRSELEEFIIPLADELFDRSTPPERTEV
jgi:predicted nucleotidyltransferase component of viral defense system